MTPSASSVASGGRGVLERAETGCSSGWHVPVAPTRCGDVGGRRRWWCTVHGMHRGLRSQCVCVALARAKARTEDAGGLDEARAAQQQRRARQPAAHLCTRPCTCRAHAWVRWIRTRMHARDARARRPRTAGGRLCHRSAKCAQMAPSVASAESPSYGQASGGWATRVRACASTAVAGGGWSNPRSCQGEQRRRGLGVRVRVRVRARVRVRVRNGVRLGSRLGPAGVYLPVRARRRELALEQRRRRPHELPVLVQRELGEAGKKVREGQGRPRKAREGQGR